MAYTTVNDSSKHFQAALYSGNGDTNAITFGGNSDMQPDWVWIKCRSSGSTNPYCWDSTRGVTKYISPSQTIAQSADAASLTAFGSDGFTMGDGGAEMNHSDGRTYIGWGWKANGGTTSTNSDGNIDTTVQVNTTAGFSIAQWEGANSTATLGHGLGAVPELIMSKCIDTTQEWGVYHQGLGNDDYLHLNEDAAEQDNNAYWNDTTPTSTVWSVGNSGPTNDNGDTMIAYVFTPIQGFSKFGTYTGNGVNPGTFVHTGFKPRLVIIKNFSRASTNWIMCPGTIDTLNPVNDLFEINNSDAADTAIVDIDFYSNGFTQRGTGHPVNTSGDTYVYMAWAEEPFVTSTGIPGTAR